VKKAASHLHAIFFALCGYSCWVTGDTFLKLACELGVPKYEIMTIAGLSGLIVIFLFTLLRGQIGRLRPRKHGALLVFGLLFLINYVAVMMALTHLSLANFYVVYFLAPMIVAILAATFLREPLTIQKIMAIIAGFIGVVVAVNPTHLLSNKGDWIGYGATLVGVCGFVIQMLILRMIGAHENREATAFYPRFSVIFAGLAAALVLGFEPVPLKGIAYCLATGGIGSFGWMAMAHAYKLAPAATVAPFHYSEIIIGAVLGYLIWHDIPSLNLLIGAVIIIASGIYIILHTRKTTTLLEQETHV
jgi:S-adenosylmethionine uptake transporter